MNIKFFTILVLFAWLFISCQKEDEIVDPTQAISLNVTNPLDKSKNVGSEVILSWTLTNCQMQYFNYFSIEYGMDSVNTKKIDAVIDSIFVLSGIKEASKYYWRVNLHFKDGKVFRGKFHSFTTKYDFDISYNVTVPIGKLPYPHHDPKFDVSQYQNMVNSLFILNNFGLYQGSTDPNGMVYLHTGLDFMVPNGTKIFALQPGKVVELDSRSSYYKGIVIQDINNPEYAWSYWHTDNFQVSLGDIVEQGQYIAEVSFYSSAPHIDLSRIKYVNASSQNSMFLYPDIYFFIPDTESPIIEPNFYFVENETDNIISKGNNATINGKVDIIVKMRDGGESNYDKTRVMELGYGNRNAVEKITYQIKSTSEAVLKTGVFDFKKVELKNILKEEYNNEMQWLYVKQLFRPYFCYNNTSANWDKIMHCYAITNFPENEFLGELDLNLINNNWNTKELLPNGTQKYPNGEYIIEVKAYDRNNNYSIVTQRVIVNN